MTASILILDDDQAHAKSVALLLAAYGLTANVRSDPFALLDELRDAPPNLLLLDLNMPALTGLEVLARMRNAGIEVATIVVSGERDIATVAPLLRLGAVDYLPKPFDPAQLISSVRNTLERVSLARENARLAAQMRAEQTVQQLILGASPDAVYMLDGSGQLVFANERFRQTFGVADATVAGALDHLPPDLLHLVYRRGQSGEMGKTQHREIHWVNPTGDVRIFDVATTLIAPTRQDQSLAGIYGSLRDVTAQRASEDARMELQNRLQQASKMEAIGQIAGGIAHDFNNILASMVGYAELVRRSRRRLQEERVDACLDEVISAGYRARDLIAQMLAFSRASRAAPRSVDLQSAITDVSRMLRAAIPGVVELKTDRVGHVRPVRADPVQIQQIVINLLVNARDALADIGAGRIDVSLTEEQSEGVCSACGMSIEGAKIVLTVTDSGHGISPDVRERLFDMYFTTRAPGKGTGIGLWLVNRLVHEYEGHILVESSPGAGARFSVVFPPAEDMLAAADNAHSPSVTQRRAGRVVLVDDEVSVVNFMSEALRDAGYEVVVFHESLPALRYLEQHHEHVTAVLTDQHMPLMSGMDLTARLRELRPDLPIALVSANLDVEAAMPGERPPFDRVLAKPFRMDELVNLLEDLTAPKQ